MTISGYQPGSIKARLDAMREEKRQMREAALAKLDEAGKKHDDVNTEIDRIATELHKEADAALAEFASFTNGPPE